eukprot:546682-Pleurochrysis_carterae.AAC.2
MPRRRVQIERAFRPRRILITVARLVRIRFEHCSWARCARRCRLCRLGQADQSGLHRLSGARAAAAAAPRRLRHREAPQVSQASKDVAHADSISGQKQSLGHG